MASCGALARESAHAAARMRSRPAEVEIADRRARRKAPLVDLAGQQFPVKDMSSNQAESRLEIGRSEHEPVLDRVGKVRREPAEDRDDRVGRRLALGVRPSAGAIVRIVLREDREDMLAGRRQRRIGRRLEKALDQRRFALAAPRRVVVRLLQVVDGRGDVDRRAVVRLRLRSGTRAEVRQFAERQIEF